MDETNVTTEVQDTTEVDTQQEATTQVGETQTEDTTAADTPKYTDADVDRIVDKKFAKFKAELEKKDEEKAQAVAEAEKLAKMGATEKAEYEQQQAQKRYKEMQEKLEKLEKQNSYNAMSKQAAAMLSEEDIVANDAVLSMVVVSDDAEQTQANIKAFSQLVKDGVAAGVKEALKGDALRASRQSEPPDAFAEKINKYK